MTSRLDTPRPATVNAYLRRATWGLPRAQQQALWDELEEHLLSRAAHLELGGLSPTHALLQATRELGPPSRVALGMTQVYTMPNLILAAGAALALTATLYAMAGGNPGPITLFVVPSAPVTPICVRGTVPNGKYDSIVRQDNGVTCYTRDMEIGNTGAFLSGFALAEAINQQGGRATLRNNRTLTVSLPGKDAGGGTVNTRFTINGEPYFDGATLVTALNTSLPITLSGYNAPRVQVGSLDLQFGNDSIEVGREFYNPLSGRLVAVLLGREASPFPTGGWFAANPGGPRHVVRTALGLGEVVMLITKGAGERYTADTAPVLTDGTVALQSKAGAVRFVSDLAQLGPYPSGGRINAMLVHVTNIPLNRLKTGIFVPIQRTSDAAQRNNAPTNKGYGSINYVFNVCNDILPGKNIEINYTFKDATDIALEQGVVKFNPIAGNCSRY